MTDYLGLVINGGALVIVAWLVWFQNRRQFPNFMKHYSHELQQERAIYAASVQEIVKSINRLTRILLFDLAKRSGEQEIGPLLEMLDSSDDDSKCAMCPFKKFAEAKTEEVKA